MKYGRSVRTASGSDRLIGKHSRVSLVEVCSGSGRYRGCVRTASMKQASVSRVILSRRCLGRHGRGAAGDSVEYSTLADS